MTCPSRLREFDTDVPDPGRRDFGDGINARLLAALLRHRHWMLMAENGVVRDVVGPIRDAKRAIDEALGRAATQEAAEDLSGWSQRRLATLRRRFEEIIAIADADTTAAMRSGLNRVSEREAEILTNILQRETPDKVISYLGLNFAGPSAEQLRTLVEMPLGGSTWSERMRRNFGEATVQMKRSLGTSVALGEGMPEAAQRIKRAVDDIAMNRATMIARTEIQRVSNATATRIYRQNKDVLKGQRFTATLDERTCLMCAPLDGEVFRIGETAEQPPLHPACRCFLAPVTKSFEELGLPVEEFPPSTRASMNGQVPATRTYSDWFADQSQSFQREVLGPGRFERFSRGDLSLDRMATTQRVLPLDALPENP